MQPEVCYSVRAGGMKPVKQAKYNQQDWPRVCFGCPSFNILTGVSALDLVLLVVVVCFNEALAKNLTENANGD